MFRRSTLSAVLTLAAFGSTITPIQAGEPMPEAPRWPIGS